MPRSSMGRHRKDDGPQHSSAETSARKDQLLVWPTPPATAISASNNTGHLTRGLCVGWMDESSADWPVETVIVAGILPIPPASAARKNDFATTPLRHQIETMKENCCYCCTCRSRIQRAHVCDGCTRRICFEKLNVVAFLDDGSTGKASSFLAVDVPTITLSPQKLPRWSTSLPPDNGRQSSTQILLYDNPADVTLYCHESAPETSFFSKTLLTRLTHAAAVVDALLWLSATSDVVTPKNVSRPSTQKLQGDATVAVDDEAEDGKSVSFSSATLAFLWRHSLLFRHCFAKPQRSRMVPVLDVLKRCYRNCTKTRSSLDVCPTCKRMLLIRKSHHEATNESITESNEFALALCDALLGSVLAFMLYHHFWNLPDWKALLKTHIQSHHRLLTSGLQWLERFPIGFKLNESLTEQAGREIQRLWNVHEWTMLRVVSDYSEYLQPVAVGLAVLVSGLLGASGLMALLFDCTRVLTLHISSIALCTRVVYAFEIYLLAALWRLFRGKKRNILRHRTDTMEHDSMQLLLGTILFAIALFLFTTIFVYHAYFTALYLATTVVALLFTVPYILIHSFPLGSVLQRYRRPRTFTREVFLEEQNLAIQDSETLDYATRLALRPVGYARIMLDKVSPPMQTTLSWTISFVVGSLSGQGPSNLIGSILSDTD